MAVFGVILVAFFIPWNSVLEADNRFSQSEELKTQAQRTASFLVSTQGYPNNWEKSNVEVVLPGFADEDNVISMSKLRKFASMEFENQRSLLKDQGFSMEYYDTETDKILEYNESEYLDKSHVGTQPIAYLVQDTSFSNLEMLEELNSSSREWYFYFPSTSNQDQLDHLTAEKVYTNAGDVKPMYERMVKDSMDKGWSHIRNDGVVQAEYISFTADVKEGKSLEIFYKGPDDRLNIVNLANETTETLSIGSSFQRLGDVADFTASEGLELSFIDQNDNLAFYSYEERSVSVTSQGAKDAGGSADLPGGRTVFLVTSNDKLGYYQEGTGVATSHDAA
ncbi:MAG: hypothetical protein BRC26_02440, partial [Nanohaloarchaea archaeon QH_8_44_6]